MKITTGQWRVPKGAPKVRKIRCVQLGYRIDKDCKGKEYRVYRVMPLPKNKYNPK